MVGAADYCVQKEQDYHIRAEQLLVVDASAPAAAKSHLRWFRIPYFAEILLLFRAWLVSHASTVNARVEDLVACADRFDVGPSRGQKKTHVARMIDPVDHGARLGRLLWLGDSAQWSGRWTLSAALKCLLKGRLPRKGYVTRHFAQLHEWTARVPTSFFSVPPEIAVQLLVHGYVSTAQAIMESSGGALEKFPGVERFAKLLGLEMHRLDFPDSAFLGSASDFRKHYRFLVQVSGMDCAYQLQRAALTAGQMIQAVERQIAEGRLLAQVLEERRDHLTLGTAHAANFRRADRLCSGDKGNYPTTVEQLAVPLETTGDPKRE